MVGILSLARLCQWSGRYCMYRTVQNVVCLWRERTFLRAPCVSFIVITRTRRRYKVFEFEFCRSKLFLEYLPYTYRDTDLFPFSTDWFFWTVRSVQYSSDNKLRQDIENYQETFILSRSELSAIVLWYLQSFHCRKSERNRTFLLIDETRLWRFTESNQPISEQWA